MRRKRLKTVFLMMGAGLLWTANALADNIQLTDSQFSGELVQGTDYTITGVETTADWYYDPDFFTLKDDGTLTFNAISGVYTIVADAQKKYYQVYAGTPSAPSRLDVATNSGAIWLIGSAGVGKPSFVSAGSGWQTGVAHGICMAEVAPHVHQVTLEVGRQLKAGDVNFKFFGQPEWGTEFKGTANNCMLSTESELFGIGLGSDGHDDGNIYLKNGASLALGDVCVFTVDCTAGLDKAVMTVDVTRSGHVLHPVFDGVEMMPVGSDYIYKGVLTQGNTYVASGEDAMNDDDWYVNPDFFERQADGALKFLAMTGSYAVRADFQQKWFNVYPIDDEGNPLTMQPDGTGAVYAIGLIGKPYHHGTDGDSWQGNIEHAAALAPIAPKVYRLTLTVGKEIDAANPEFKLYCQPGWGKEFNPADASQYDIDINLNYQFVVGRSNGNIYADPEAIWEDGDTYVFTLDCTDMPKAHLTVTGGKAVAAIGEVKTNVTRSFTWHTLSGMSIQKPTKSGIYVNKGKKYIIK